MSSPLSHLCLWIADGRPATRRYAPSSSSRSRRRSTGSATSSGAIAATAAVILACFLRTSQAAAQGSPSPIH